MNWFKTLPQSAVIRLTGDDAAKVLNNLFTNDVVSLQPGQSCEGFVTNVRGWSVAFGMCLRTADGVSLLCQHSAAQEIADHIDRYIIREDAVISNDSDSTTLVVVSDCSSAVKALEATSAVAVVPATVVGPDSGLVVVANGDLASNLSNLEQAGFNPASDAALAEARIRAMWPFQALEIGEKTIPQEMDRDDTAISFTKGCYLGQETIARLDARGQLQKKLCLVELENYDADASETSQLGADGKPAGTLTSVQATGEKRAVALAILKRGNFDPGTKLSCGDASATVIARAAAE